MALRWGSELQRINIVSIGLVLPLCSATFVQPLEFRAAGSTGTSRLVVSRSDQAKHVSGVGGWSQTI
jgi:hypothetical protein